jgi:hypothetical protein
MTNPVDQSDLFMQSILDAAAFLANETNFPEILVALDAEGNPALPSAISALAFAVKQHVDVLRMTALLGQSSVSYSYSSSI